MRTNIQAFRGCVARTVFTNRENRMKREIIRVEPLSTYLERWKAPTSAVTRHGDTRLCVRLSSVRPRNRRSDKRTHRKTDRNRARSDEAMPGNSRIVSRQGFEVQRVLYVGREIRRRQCGLRALLSERPAGTHFHLLTGMARSFRHRDRL